MPAVYLKENVYGMACVSCVTWFAWTARTVLFYFMFFFFVVSKMWCPRHSYVVYVLLSAPYLLGLCTVRLLASILPASPLLSYATITVSQLFCCIFFSHFSLVILFFSPQHQIELHLFVYGTILVLHLNDNKKRMRDSFMVGILLARSIVGSVCFFFLFIKYFHFYLCRRFYPPHDIVPAD